MKKHTAQFKRRRRQQGRVRRLLGALVLALDLMLGLAPGLSAPQEAQAADSRIVYSSSGRAMFELVLYAPGEAPEAAGGATTGTRAVSSSDVQGAAAAAGLWADLLGPYSANTEPVRIDVTGLDIYNAGADCYGKIQDGLRLSLPLRQIAFGESSADAAGFIVIGTGISSSSLWTQADHLSPVPETDDPDLAAVIFHELGHLAGMGSSVLSTLEQIAGE
ncbi:MAG: hypothetical protein Q4F72_10750, partial [Desulfovibrionaceae bacterium]|nr:hypothetical protein [Desulfovibrionaceae bacterium]